jgi:ATP-dependent protease HslVU (ClpYQ) peptidase subunit
VTAVLVVVQDGRAWVGADSRVTNSGTYRDDAAKVVERHGWVWAIAGASATAAWLRTQLRPQRPDEDDEAYLLDVSAAAQTWLKERDDLCGNKDITCAHFVAAKAGRAWVATGYGVETIGELYAMGDPTAPAAAFLCTDWTGLPVPARIRHAIEATARVSAYVGGPITVVEAT